MEDPDFSVECDSEPPVLLLNFENVLEGSTGPASTTYEEVLGPDATVYNVKAAIAQHEGILEQHDTARRAPL